MKNLTPTIVVTAVCTLLAVVCATLTGDDTFGKLRLSDFYWHSLPATQAERTQFPATEKQIRIHKEMYPED